MPADDVDFLVCAPGSSVDVLFDDLERCVAAGNPLVPGYAHPGRPETKRPEAQRGRRRSIQRP